jgi:hypothetical protein
VTFLLCEQDAATCNFSQNSAVVETTALFGNPIFDSSGEQYVDPMPTPRLLYIKKLSKIQFVFYGLISLRKFIWLGNAKLWRPPSFWTGPIRHVWRRQLLLEVKARRSSLLQSRTVSRGLWFKLLTCTDTNLRHSGKIVNYTNLNIFLISPSNLTELGASEK